MGSIGKNETGSAWRRGALDALAKHAVMVILASVLWTTAAAAHPMGNFAVCHFAAIRPFTEEIRIHYIIDMAEVPTYHELKKIDTNGDKQYTDSELSAYLEKHDELLVSGLDLEIDGERRPLDIRDSNLEIRDGLPGLKILWFEFSLSASVPEKQWPKRTVSYADNNFPDDMGWKEIRVFGSPETVIIEKSELSPKTSDGLTNYPESLTGDPPLDLSVTFTYGPGSSDELYALDSGAAPDKSEKQLGFSERVMKKFDIFPYLEKETLSTRVVIVGIIFAFILGCFHALAPGHGKTLVAAYLVGTKGRPTDALTLGFIVTFTHVAAVLAIFVILLSFWDRLNTEHLYGWLAAASGVVIAGMGLWIIFRNYRGKYIPHVHDEFGRHVSPEELKNRPELLEHSSGHGPHGHTHSHDAHHNGHSHDHDHSHDHHSHDHDHSHDHEYGHQRDTGESLSGAHTPPNDSDKSRKGVRFIDLLTLGVTGGIVPCPTAIIILFASIGLNRLAFGLILMISFSVGLAFVLIAIGLMIVYTRNFAESRMKFETSRVIGFLPYVSGALVALIGLGIFINGLRSAGLI